MVVYSYSRLNTFEQCPLKYKFSYLDKESKDFDSSIEAIMGSLVHDALEKLYKDLKYQKILTKDQLINYYKHRWTTVVGEKESSVKIVKSEYSFDHYKKMGIKYLKDYYDKYSPFDQDYTLGLEIEVEIDIFNNSQYKLKGYVDRLAMKDDVLIIHDYKTSNTLPTEDEIKNDKQLSLYALALKDKYNGTKRVELVWHYLAFNKEIRVVKSESNEALKHFIKSQIDKIEVLQAEEFVPKESILCDWCEFASLCPKKKHIVKTKQLGLEEFSKDYGVNLAKDYFEKSDKIAELKLELAEIEEKIFAYAEREKIDNIYGGLGTLKIYNDLSYKLPVKGTPKFKHIQDVVTKSKLDELLTIDSYNFIKSVNTGLLPEDVFNEISTMLERKKNRRIYIKKNY